MTTVGKAMAVVGMTRRAVMIANNTFADQRDVVSPHEEVTRQTAGAMTHSLWSLV